MSDTPRTDQFEEAYFAGLTTQFEDGFDFARNLERENAALRADKDRLDSGRIMLRIYDSMDGWKTCEFVGQDLRAAIDVARKGDK